MRELSLQERQKAAILKAYRTAIRLKYSLMADDEIMRNLPRIEAEVDQAINTGQALELSPGDVFDWVDDETANHTR